MKRGILCLLFVLIGSSSRIEATKDYLPIKKESALDVFNACGLSRYMQFSIFQKAFKGITTFKPKKSIIAICDFTVSSDKKRFYLIDVEHKKLLVNTLVAHGKNSGALIAKYFSNTPESYKSSKGFFNIGSQIISPKHGIALLLEGLERGINDNAKKREIIIHGADYVSESFIQKYGRLGRSFGCPALPQDVVNTIAPLVADGGLLYIHTQ